MSQWEYEAGRRIVMQNIVNGDFSNLPTWAYDTPEKRKKLIADTKRELDEQSSASRIS